jgi:hypothetical protein
MLRERLPLHRGWLAEHATAHDRHDGNFPLPSIDRIPQTPAGIMGYLDIFGILGLLSLNIWPLALLLRTPKSGAGH